MHVRIRVCKGRERSLMISRPLRTLARTMSSCHDRRSAMLFHQRRFGPVSLDDRENQNLLPRDLFSFHRRTRAPAKINKRRAFDSNLEKS